MRQALHVGLSTLTGALFVMQLTMYAVTREAHWGLGSIVLAVLFAANVGLAVAVW